MPLDPCSLPAGYYWVRTKGVPKDSRKPKIMERCDDGSWWHMGWDIQEREMYRFEVLAEVEPYRAKHVK